MKKLILTILCSMPLLVFGNVDVKYSFENASPSDDAGMYQGTLVNNAEIVTMKDGNHVLFTGSENGYMDLGRNIGTEIMSKLDGNFSATVDVYEDPNDNNLTKDGNFLWCFSSQSPNSAPTNYVMLRIKNSAVGYTLRYNSTNNRLGESASLTPGKWQNITYVHSGDSAFLYLDGVRIEAKSYIQNFGPWGGGSSYVSPSSLFENIDSLSFNYIGRSAWSSNAYVKNAYVDNFRIVNSVLDQKTISAHCNELASYSTELEGGASTRDAYSILRTAVSLAERLQAAGLNQSFVSSDGVDLLAAAKSMINAATAPKDEADTLASQLADVAKGYIDGSIAAKASETNEYPLTALIVNPSFITKENTTAAVKGWSGDIVLNQGSSDGSLVDANLKYNTKKFDVYQQLTGLPNGTYRVEASAKISYLLEKYLYAVTAKGTLKQRLSVNGKMWSIVSNNDSLNTILDSVVVTDGNLKIGFLGENSKNDALIDNVCLYYIGSGQTSDAYNKTSGTGIVFPDTVTSADLPSSETVKDIITKVNDTWQTNNSYNVSSFWDRAVYQTGNMAAYFYTGNSAYRDYALAWAQHNKWYGSTGDDPTQWKYSYGEGSNYALFGDWQCCFQTYIDLYNSDENKPDSMIARAKQVMSYMANQDTVAYWWWADALYMAMPVMTKMYKLTGDNIYLQRLYDYFSYARNLMYDETGYLFFRDANYIYPSHATTRGLPDYWSRGDGWVAAGLAKVLADMPDTCQHYDYFKSIYKDICSEVVKHQKAEGFWTESIVDTLFATCYESSGTSLFTYAIIWGVNNGILDECEYFPYIKRAWNYLTTIALQDNGTVGYMQPIGAAASEGAVLYPTNVTNFGTGAFLLAATEMGRYADKKITTRINTVTSSLLKESVRGIYSLDGKRMTKTIKGINIVNGKKILVK